MDPNNQVPEVDNSLDKFYQDYKDKIQNEFGGTDSSEEEDNVISNEYLEFKEQYIPTHFSLYEKGCNIAEKILKISPDKKKSEEIIESLEICHLNVTPT